MPTKMHRNTIDCTGRKFGELLVIAYAGRRNNATLWTCKCLLCGDVSEYIGGNLRHGHSARCLKCSYRQRQKKRVRKSNQPGYHSWYRITRSGHMCKRWRSFDTFLADMGEPPKRTHALVRLDPQKPYSPENCVWAAPGTRFLTLNGQTKPLTQWAEELGLTRQALYLRLEKMSLSDALTTPPLRKRRN